MKEYLKIFKALGEKTRLRIVMMLKVKPMCVCEIREIIDSSMSTISSHLRILNEANIIEFQKEDRYVNYELSTSNEVVQQVLNILEDMTDAEIQLGKQKVLKIDRINIC